MRSLPKVYVYNFADLALLHQIDTLANKAGLCAVSCEPKPMVLACPGIHRGQARFGPRRGGDAALVAPAGSSIWPPVSRSWDRSQPSSCRFPSPCWSQVRVERYEVNKTRFIAAHEGALASLAMSADGSRVATASEKGTIVRVFDSLEGSQLFELRRGADQAMVHSLGFSPACDWLAATSDKGTVHIFSLTAKPQGQAGAGAGAAGGQQQGQQQGEVSGVAGDRHKSAGQGRSQSGAGAAKLAQSSVSFVVRRSGFAPRGMPS